jgi:hypothetical protein
MPEKKKTAADKAAEQHAAERRGDAVRSLEEERWMAESAGKTERVKEIDAALKKVQKVATRKAPESDKA